MKVLNNKLVVLGILLFLSFIIIALSCYAFYLLNTNEECICDNLASPEITKTEENNENLEEEKITIEVKGSVKSPGVYTLNNNSIVNDAILASGGFLDNAYTDNINLSKKLENEMVVYVYNKKEYEKDNSKIKNTNSYQIDSAINDKISIITSDVTSSIQDDTSSSTNKLININLASLNELMELPGIGESKANKIITYRETNGYFSKIEDIKNVSGIGDATFEELKALITV